MRMRMECILAIQNIFMLNLPFGLVLQPRGQRETLLNDEVQYHRAECEFSAPCSKFIFELPYFQLDRSNGTDCVVTLLDCDHHSRGCTLVETNVVG